MQAMGSGCKCRGSFTCSSTTHLLLCSPVPNRPWPGTGQWSQPGVGDPCPSGLLPQRPSSLPAQAHTSYIGSGEGGFFFSYPIVLLAFDTLGPCPFIFLAFGATQCKNLPMCYLGLWGRLPGASWLSIGNKKMEMWTQR